ncbi:hypothetical protein Plec18167_006156 [Paecilomyces lecythidis]|uniref:Uncharacterized protein n=1 Tax=Paecilomyces lecythidis TaxID=3004212 RepID=A0ABR3XCI3_9EURO
MASAKGEDEGIAPGVCMPGELNTVPAVTNPSSHLDYENYIRLRLQQGADELQRARKRNFELETLLHHVDRRRLEAETFLLDARKQQWALLEDLQRERERRSMAEKKYADLYTVYRDVYTVNETLLVRLSQEDGSQTTDEEKTKLQDILLDHERQGRWIVHLNAVICSLESQIRELKQKLESSEMQGCDECTDIEDDCSTPSPRP